MDILKNIIDKNQIENIPASKIDDLIEEGAFILDVRTEEEYKERSVKNSVNIPLQELDVRYTELPDKKIYILCRSGARSLEAARFLKIKGFDVCNIKGGIIEYPGK